MTAQPATIADLTALIAPFVGTFRQIHRGDGSRIDIHHICDSIDADVREVTDEGVRLFSYDRADLIPWAKVRGVTVAGPGCEVVYTHDRAIALRAA